jgi:hypothetical protein
MNVQLGWNITEDGTRIYSYNGQEVLRIKFNSDAYAEAGFLQLKDKAIQFEMSGEGLSRFRASVEEFSRKHGTRLTEEQVKALEKEVLRIPPTGYLRIVLLA